MEKRINISSLNSNANSTNVHLKFPSLKERKWINYFKCLNHVFCEAIRSRDIKISKEATLIMKMLDRKYFKKIEF